MTIQLERPSRVEAHAELEGQDVHGRRKDGRQGRGGEQSPPPGVSPELVDQTDARQRRANADEDPAEPPLPGDE